MRNRTACQPVRRRNSPPLAVQTPSHSRPHELTMAFGPGDLPAVRAGVIAYLGSLVVEDRLEDVVLVVHELAANVVRHGGGYGNLQLSWDGDRIVCRVSDSGPGLNAASASAPERPSPRMPGGRGLFIARQLSDLWIDSGPGGTTITATMPLG
jgi:anti-sigma regulatory factor (Ser/Thr protein kinase)